MADTLEKVRNRPMAESRGFKAAHSPDVAVSARFFVNSTDEPFISLSAKLFQTVEPKLGRIALDTSKCLPGRVTRKHSPIVA